MLFKSVFVFVTLFAFTLASDVLDLSDDDFNTRVAETETTLVMFYAPWQVFLIHIFFHSILWKKTNQSIFPSEKFVCLFVFIIRGHFFPRSKAKKFPLQHSITLTHDCPYSLNCTVIGLNKCAMCFLRGLY